MRDYGCCSLLRFAGGAISVKYQVSAPRCYLLTSSGRSRLPAVLSGKPHLILPPVHPHPSCLVRPTPDPSADARPACVDCVDDGSHAALLRVRQTADHSYGWLEQTAWPDGGVAVFVGDQCVVCTGRHLLAVIYLFLLRHLLMNICGRELFLYDSLRKTNSKPRKSIFLACLAFAYR